MVQSGELTPETQGWHAGCSGWMPLRELPALADFLNPREPEESEEEPLEQEEQPEQTEEKGAAALPPVPTLEEASQQQSAPLPESAILQEVSGLRMPGMGVRLLARLVDMTIYCTLMYLTFYLLEVDFSMNLLPYGPLFWVGLVGMEALSLYMTGTTPGKRLVGIRLFSGVRAAENVTALSPGISFGQALGRSFLVFVGGLGMMVYFLPFIMGPLSAYLLKRRGFTSWDARARTLPLQIQQPPVFRYLLAFAILYSGLNIVSYCMQPWIPAMLQEMEAVNPEYARTLRQMMPPEAVPADRTEAPAPAGAESTEPGSIRFLEL